MPLLHGRIEVARLNLSDPSLNLVRNESGHWNLESLLQRAAETPVAPTTKSTSEPRPGFPYIEASSARINFKLLHEKVPHALNDVDFSVWQDSENTWGMRLEGEPIRTDFNLNDTGTLKVSGSWQRAGSLRDTPLKFNLHWQQAQLGEVTKLVYAADKGWRGSVVVSATLSGTPGNLKIASQASLQDFRRYDILADGPLQLVARCGARYSSVTQLLSEIDCRAPINGGEVALEGELSGYWHPKAIDLSLSALDVPVQGLVALLRHAKDDLPKDLLAAGVINGSLEITRDAAGGIKFKGDGEATGLHVASKSTKADLALDRIHFAVAKANNKSGEFLEIGPLAVAMGRPTPVTISAHLSRDGYNVQVQGDSQIRRLIQNAQTVGLSVPKFSADGNAKVDLSIAGEWRGFAAPSVTGKAQLHNVRADIKGLDDPLQISSASLALSADKTRISNIVASLAGGTWHGSAEIPRPCSRETNCTMHFNLLTDNIDTTRLREATERSSPERIWSRFLPRKTSASFLTSLHATGKITADQLTIRGLAASRVSSEVDLDAGKLTLTNLQGSLMGSRHRGDWKIDFTKQPPIYSGSGTLDEVDLEQLAVAMHDGWVTGTAGASYEVKASGNTVADLLEAASATITVEAREGNFPHLTLAENPLEFERFLGKFNLNDRTLQIADGKLQTSDATYQVTGSASLSNTLDFRLILNTGRGFNVTGSLTLPRVEPAVFPETQAALHP
jgi:uncharacterized protein involved in outer membrane biogenesis